MDNCKDFAKVASSLLRMKIIPLPDDTETLQSQVVEDSQLSSTPLGDASQAVQDISLDNSLAKEGISLPDLARKVLHFVFGCQEQ